jgi:acyl carrier protein
VESSGSDNHVVAEELERFVRAVGQVADDDPDFTREIHLLHSGYLDSRGVIDLIAHIEEHFRVELGDDDLSDPAFTNIDGMSGIIEAALRARRVRT